MKKINKQFNGLIQHQGFCVGFTLMELVVSIAVFSILSLVIMGIYVAFSNNQWRAQAGQKVLNDGQYALEVIAREIRNDAIYYNQEPTCPKDASSDYDYCLRLQQSDGSIIAFAGYNNSTQIFYAKFNGLSWDMTELINFHKILDLSFEVNPSPADPLNNPYLSGGPDQQPKVTIKLVIQPDTERAVEKITYRLQTTVSSRVYQR